MKTFYRKVLLAFGVLMATSLGCVSVPFTVSVPLTPSPLSTNTAVPTKTLTPTPTSTPTPAPTLSPVEFSQKAGPLCETAFSSSNAFLHEVSAPLVHLFQYDYLEDKQWSVFNHLFPPAEAVTESDVKAVVCVRASRQRIFSYQDGEPGYQLTWNIRLISWPDGNVIGSETFRGDRPPGIKFGSGPEYGRSPQDQLNQWVYDHLTNRTFFYTGDRVSKLTFSPDGQFLVAAKGLRFNVAYEGSSFDMAISVWNVVTRETIHVLHAHTKAVYWLPISPDGKLLASSDSDCTLKIWDLSTGELLKSFNGPGCNSEFSPDGKYLLIAGESSGVKLMDTASFEIVNVLPQIGGMTFSPDGKILIFTRVGATTFIDMESLQPVKSFDETVQGDLKFDSNGRLLAIEGRWLDPIQVIDFETKQVISTITPDNLPITISAFSPYGLLATGSQGGTVSVWDWETGMLLREIQVSPFDEIASLAFNPAGSLLAVGDNGGIITLWDVSDLR